MAVAVAAPPSLPVSTTMSAQMMVRVVALLFVTSGAAVAAPAAPAECQRCVEPSTIDSTHARVVRSARLAAHEGEWARAAELWRNALLMDERVADHWIAMGDALTGAQRYLEAVAAYQRSIQLDPRVTRPSTRRVARAYALIGNDKQAVRWLEQSLRTGTAPEELWAEELFGRYRHEPRLRTLMEHHVDLRGGGPRARRAVPA